MTEVCEEKFMGHDLNEMPQLCVVIEYEALLDGNPVCG